MNLRFDFNQGWKFAREHIPAAADPDYPLSELADWEDVTLPHTARYEPYDNHGIPTFQGQVTYCRRFPADPALRGKRLFLEFEAVMGVCDVWLNGVQLHTAFGDAAPDQDGTVHTSCCGYLPFVVELTQQLRFGQDNLLTVFADNRDAPQVPPGKPQELLDFTYWGGIYRSVWLDAVEPVHITNPLFENICAGGGVVFALESADTAQARAQVRVHVRNSTPSDRPVRVRAELLDEQGRTAACCTADTLLPPQGDGVLRIPLCVESPYLWNLDSPYLYTLSCTLFDGSTAVHTDTQRVGLRRITISRQQGVCINGVRAPLLSGVNRHQDYPILGNAACARLQRMDAVLFRSAGFTVVRAAHYPMAEAFLDVCDELGILVIEATPGWQWYPSGDDQPFTSRVHNNIRQMVRRDRNHPCILAYETVLNETYHVPYGYNRRMEQTALEESADARVAAESYGYDAAPDANGIDDLADLIYGFEQPLEKTSKAVMFLREYGDSWQEAYGVRMSRRVTRGSTGSEYPGGPEQNLIKANKLLFDRCDGAYTLADRWAAYREDPSFAGCAIWTGIDSRGMRSILSPCGIWDAFRLPKTSCFALESQRPAQPIPLLEARGVSTGLSLHIACGGPLDQGPQDIYVYSNAARVCLSVHRGGETLFTACALPMQEGLCAHLPHPPFLFRDVPCVPGCTLTADAYSGSGQHLGQTTAAAPGCAHRISLETALHSRCLTADGSDTVLVYARILDQEGRLCSDIEPSVLFRVEGDACLVGSECCFSGANPARAEAGIASVYLRAGHTPGPVRVTACAAGLESGEITLQSKPSCLPAFPFTAAKQNSCRFSASFDLADKLLDGGYAEDVYLSGTVYPHSVRLSGTAVFDLRGAYTRLYARIHPHTAVPVFRVDGTRVMPVQKDGFCCVALNRAQRLSVQGREASILLSPVLSDEPLSERETRTDVTAGAQAHASSHTETAGLVLQPGHMWQTLWMGEKLDGQPAYFQLDLAGVFDVEDAMVCIGGQMGSDCTNYSYEIHTSPDGVTWQLRCKNRRTSWSNGVIDRFRAPGTRSVRIVFTQVDGGLLPALYHIELYQASV